MGMALILLVLMILGMQVEAAAHERGKKNVNNARPPNSHSWHFLILEEVMVKGLFVFKKLCFHLKHITVFKKVIQSSAMVFASIISKEGV